MAQTREAAIVGIHEYPLRVAPGVSALQIKADSAARALEDAGLSWSDVDAVYDTGSHQSVGGLGISEYFGIMPKLIDNTAVGGTSYEFQANHAAAMIAGGQVQRGAPDLRLHRSLRPTGHRHGRRGRRRHAEPATNMEASWGQTLIGNYAMVKQRHLYQYGSTNEQFAHISIATRKHAMRNREAVKAMTDLEFVGVRELTVEDVVDSRMIAWPLRLLECCMISDGGALWSSPQRMWRQLRQEACLDHRVRRGDQVPRERRGHHRERGRSIRPARVRRRRGHAGRDRRADGLRFFQHNGNVHDRRPRILHER